MATTRKAFIQTLEAAIEEHFEPISRRYSWVTRSGELVWMIALDEDPGRPWFGFKPVRYAHRDWVAPDMNNMACGAIVDDEPVIRGCPILCVRGLGLQVVRESVGVSHG
ncbi:hypothetical protein CGLAUT_01205 [Corynebacterium glaucum]|uniref:hypothetical protein n=1 Tax=Corynebacterium glaucum TaxID=187491 RepID=UPI0031E10009|nr:hypothetical protein CGLAUT_01205 [Corynebacterium glaucum]